jgi:hypothetical protein
MSTQIQSIAFKKSNKWTHNKSEAWLKSHRFKPLKKAHDTGNYLRYRLKKPNFTYYSTKRLKNGILVTFGSN